MSKNKALISEYNPVYCPLPTVVPEAPAPTGKWGPDLLGEGFSAQTIVLPRDEEGELFTTLIRYCPEEDPQAIPDTPAEPTFTFLYLHGWNDYFFQRELARHVALAGGAFYALDLAKYGRSYRDWMTLGWTDDLASYDFDIDEAKILIEADHPGLPFILSGHSTGGLTAAYWAVRHPKELAGLVLNSPWIDMNYGAVQRKAAFGIGSLVAKKHPKKPLPGQEADSSYVDSLSGWDTKIDGTLPAKLKPWLEDPGVAGWDLIRKWKGSPLALLRYGWLAGVSKAQAGVQTARAIEAPVFMATSTGSSSGKQRTGKMMHSDSVLNVETLCAQAWHISTKLTLCRYPGKHDLWLSLPPVRQQYWQDFHRWIPQAVPAAVDQAQQLTEAHRQAICP